MTLNKSVYSDNFIKMLISLSNTFLYVKHNTPGHPRGGGGDYMFRSSYQGCALNPDLRTLASNIMTTLRKPG